MPLGKTALDPDTPYHVYEYSIGTKVFYVGVAWSDVRSHGRWGHVRNLLRHDDAGTLTATKAADLRRKSNQVIAALLRAGHPEHSVRVSWRGPGKAAAEAAETKRILLLLRSGNLLANESKNPLRVNLADILAHLGLRTDVESVSH